VAFLTVARIDMGTGKESKTFIIILDNLAWKEYVDLSRL
jgi:hypothetical protein